MTRPLKSHGPKPGLRRILYWVPASWLWVFLLALLPIPSRGEVFRGNLTHRSPSATHSVKLAEDGTLILKITTSVVLNFRNGVSVLESDGQTQRYRGSQGSNQTQEHIVEDLRAGTYLVRLALDPRDVRSFGPYSVEVRILYRSEMERPAPGTGSEDEPNDSPRQALALELGRSVTSRLGFRGEATAATADVADYWQVEIPDDGTLFLRVSTDRQLELKNGLHVSDAQGGNRLAEWTQSSNETETHAVPALRAGAYLIGLELGESRGFAPAQGSYTLTATHAASSFSSDPEPNERGPAAIEPGRKAAGRLGFRGGGQKADHIDLWSFTLKERAGVVLQLETSGALSLSGDDGVTVFASGDAIYGRSHGAGQFVKHHLGELEPGTYLIALTAEPASPWAWGAYSLQLDVQVPAPPDVVDFPVRVIGSIRNHVVAFHNRADGYFWTMTPERLDQVGRIHPGQDFEVVDRIVGGQGLSEPLTMTVLKGVGEQGSIALYDSGSRGSWFLYDAASGKKTSGPLGATPNLGFAQSRLGNTLGVAPNHEGTKLYHHVGKHIYEIDPATWESMEVATEARFESRFALVELQWDSATRTLIGHGIDNPKQHTLYRIDPARKSVSELAVPLKTWILTVVDPETGLLYLGEADAIHEFNPETGLLLTRRFPEGSFVFFSTFGPAKAGPGLSLYGIKPAGRENFLVEITGEYPFRPEAGPPPILLRAVPSEGTLSLEWAAVAGQQYAVQYRDQLGAGEWIDLPKLVDAVDGTASTEDETFGQARSRFYRVRVRQ